ncbi:metallophosphoesterase [Mechercharimyces sp. CAU 1602]|uniref:metallophosphoesterase family protein n=1 Tax=Mechercharimyces sp. CAU 1602 TaxID=2973933 RepID=UPI0021631CD8|nr:metallophosphoesterase [Mechercharimyces sp. CAU 1602]MCS1351229.1 metallophosphoesterase family protein [Mechercharimyces sp. CAU 1602]
MKKYEDCAIMRVCDINERKWGLGMRLLYFTDTHIRGTSPRSRMDDFPQTLKEKVLEVVKIANREEVDVILHGGDFFDRPDVSPSVVGEFAGILRKFSAPIYTIAGNHDIYGHNPETAHRSMIGLLDAFGTVTMLNQGERRVLTAGGIKVQLSGQPFHYDLDRRDVRLDYVVQNESEADFCIHMVHGMVVERALPDGVHHTLVDKLWSDDVDLLLTGHYHAGFAVQEKEGKYIVNPGALARINNHPSEMRRRPQVALITLGEKIDIQLFPLRSAPEGKDVLDRSYIEEAAWRAEKMSSFVQQVQAAGTFHSLDPVEIINEIALLEGIADEVKYEAMRRIAVIQERIGEGRA